MIDTDKYEGHLIDSSDDILWNAYKEKCKEVKRLLEEVKVLSKYRDIVIEFDDALLADGDTDMRWSAIYDERVFE